MVHYRLFVFVLVVSTVQGYRIVSDAEYEEGQHWSVYEKVGRYLAGSELRIAPDMDWLPNSNKIGYGYNPIRGDPVCYTGDCHMNGYGRSLFHLDYTNPPKGACTTKLIPQNVELDCIPSTEVQQKIQKISDMKEFKESTASGVSFGFGFELPLSNPSLDLASISFGYSQSEQSTHMLNHIYEDKSVIYHSYARISTVKLSLFAPKLELSENFRYVIDHLPATGSYTPAVEKYIQDYIINYFGFTFTSELLLGGIAQILTVVDTSVVRPQELSGTSDSHMVKLSFAKAFSFNYEDSENESSSQLQKFERYVKSSVATTLGGETYADQQKLTEWFQTVPDNPVIIKFTLQSIFDLITPARFPNDSNIGVKVKYITQALEQYLNKTTKVFCKNQCTNEKQGVCNSLGAYGYGKCRCINGFSGNDCSQPPTTTASPPPAVVTTPVAPVIVTTPVPPVVLTTPPSPDIGK